MKINILKLIEDALIGGRNGEMAYIYNNPLIEQIYREIGETPNKINISLMFFII